MGATILWFAFRDARKPLGWEHNQYAMWWNQFHGGFVAVSLGIAAALTVYSFLHYINRYRELLGPRRS